MIRVNVKTAVNAADIRQEKRNGRDVIIVPSATLPDNVIMNGGLYPAEEIEKSFMTLERTKAPVGHPIINNAFVSADEPEAINEFYIGAWNENVRRENGRVKLDKVIDVERAKESKKGRDVLDAINKSQPIHTSTGLLLEPEPVANNDDYQWIARNMQFDHDAILLDEPGAATPEQGVGMMVNSKGEEIEVINSHITDMADESLDYAAMNLIRALEDADRVSRFDALKDRIIGAVRGLMSGSNEEDASLSVNHKEDSVMPITEEQFNELAEQVKELASNQLTKDDLEAVVKPVSDQVDELKANAKARDEAEKAELVESVVKANLLDEDDAKELSVNALKKLADKAKPQGYQPLAGSMFQPTTEDDQLSSELPE